MNKDPALSAILAAVAKLASGELLELLRLLERSSASARALDGAELIALLRRSDSSLGFKTAAAFVVGRARVLRQADHSDQQHTAARVLAEMHETVTGHLVACGVDDHAPEGTSPAAAVAALPPPESVTKALAETALLPTLQDGSFIQLAYETVLDRGCTPTELRDWQLRLDRGGSRRDFLAALFTASIGAAAAEQRLEAAHDALSFHVMGTGERVTLADWQAKAKQLTRDENGKGHDNLAFSRYHIKSKPKLLVSAIASLYRGGRFIERFLQNITTQTCFRDYAELIIIDANSPDGEHEVIRPYLARCKNINYIRINHRIGIYDAWNVGIEAAQGEFLTCTNVDDLRRADSLELQAAALDNLPFADVVYQDFYYSFDPELSFEQVARFGYRSRLPLVTPYTLMAYNPPHNAPMWRRRLHAELGPFDTSYQSAGDYDFWMRCLAAGKTFHKLNEPHVVYYQNPNGLSTRPGTRGFAETKIVHKKYDRKLTSENLVMPFAQFCAQRLPGIPAQLDGGQQDRYLQVHRALRHAARTGKYQTASLQVAA